jgi:RNA polymerase sigma factor (sigma-70 family)
MMYLSKTMPDPFDTSPAADEKLVAEVILGNEGAARTLFNRLSPIIRRVSQRAPRELREDLIQEVFTHIWSRNCRMLQQWDRSGPLIHYVAVVAANVIRDRLSKRMVPTEPMVDCPDIADPNDPALDAEAESLARCVESAKNRLSEMHHELIHLRHEVALSYKEIAQKLGRTVGYVSGTLARAERYLREEIVDACADHLGKFRSLF